MIRYKAEDFDINRLGSFYSTEKTIFRVFAPYYKDLSIVIKGHSYPMHKKGLCFEIGLSSDLEGARYHFETSEGVSFSDPFAYAGKKGESIVMDPGKFIKEKIVPEKCETPIIYECSVRDFSSDDSYTGRYRKKFLSFTESGLLTKKGNPLGVDHLKQLGITHLQLLPVFEFDNDKSDYNWGYNPLAYNYVENVYLENEEDPYAYVREFRETVNALHKCGIRVVTDVVFNHVYNYAKNELGKMLKRKCFRYKPDGKIAQGTFCGNEVKSEDPFVRAYIVKMVERYLELFDIDGIRMDLMGISDIDTVNLIYFTLRKKKEDFMVYGEGWNMGDVLPEEDRAAIPNAKKMPGIAMFNDYFRDTLIHYVSGNDSIDEDVEKILMADGSYLDASQSINYSECHDDYTFFDRMMIYKNEDRKSVNEARARLSMAMVMVAKGIPFIHAGQEFLRTKNGIRNSYNSPDEINKIDWDRRDRYADSCDFLKDLISIRKKHPSLYDPDTPCEFERYEGCIIYKVDDLLILINPTGTDQIYNDGERHEMIFDRKGGCNCAGTCIPVSAYSLVICQY